MKTINFNDPNELNTALGKKCTISLDVIGFPSQNLSGILTNIEVNQHNYSLRIVIQLEDNSIAIPLKDISSFEMEE